MSVRMFVSVRMSVSVRISVFVKMSVCEDVFRKSSTWIAEIPPSIVHTEIVDNY